MTTADVLRAAKALIDTPEQWNDGGCRQRHCTSTALRAVTTHDEWDLRMAARRALCEAIGVPFNESGTHIWKWNDAPDTTHADVMAAFDKAIAIAEAA